MKPSSNDVIANFKQYCEDAIKRFKEFSNEPDFPSPLDYKEDTRKRRTDFKAEVLTEANRAANMVEDDPEALKKIEEMTKEAIDAIQP